jgi:hypothetical protein
MKKIKIIQLFLVILLDKTIHSSEIESLLTKNIYGQSLLLRD